MRRYSSCKDINKLVSRLMLNGWSYQTGGHHGKLYPPTKHVFISVPSTPSDRRGFSNFKQRVRRLV